MNTSDKKRVLASTKIYESALNQAESVATATGTKKGSIFRVILEEALSKCTHEQLKELVYGKKSIKIE